MMPFKIAIPLFTTRLNPPSTTWSPSGHVYPSQAGGRSTCFRGGDICAKPPLPDICCRQTLNNEEQLQKPPSPHCLPRSSYLFAAKMPFTPKRPCPDSLDVSMNDSMNDSMEKRIKRISIEGNIGMYPLWRFPPVQLASEAKMMKNVS